MSARAASRPDVLLSTLAREKAIVILTHDNPDPDALGSAVALQAIFRKRLDCPSRIAAGGFIGRAENRAMVSELGIEIAPVREALRQFSGAVVLVDTQPGRANNSLPPAWQPVAVIDHHPDWGGNDGVPFLDLRERYGATSTILTEYLRQIDFTPSASLATALFYGIASETRHLARETVSADVSCSEYLYPLVDKRALGAIETPTLEPAYFQLMAEALANAFWAGNVVVSVLDSVPYPDAVAEIADLLVRVEGARWAACVAPSRGVLSVSLRSCDRAARAGVLLASVLPDGAAGGHGMTAGGQTPVGHRPEDDVVELVLRILSALAQLGTPPRWLVEPRARAGSVGAVERVVEALAAQTGKESR